MSCLLSFHTKHFVALCVFAERKADQLHKAGSKHGTRGGVVGKCGRGLEAPLGPGVAAPPCGVEERGQESEGGKKGIWGLQAVL